MSIEPTALILKALDGLSARAIVTAENIANANTPGYRPMRVSFEQTLIAAAREDATLLDNFVPTTEAAEDRGIGAELRLDLELATASSTAARYAALVEILGRQLQVRALATSGGQ